MVSASIAPAATAVVAATTSGENWPRRAYLRRAAMPLMIAMPPPCSRYAVACVPYHLWRWEVVCVRGNGEHHVLQCGGARGLQGETKHLLGYSPLCPMPIA